MGMMGGDLCRVFSKKREKTTGEEGETRESAYSRGETPHRTISLTSYRKTASRSGRAGGEEATEIRAKGTAGHHF